MPESGLYIQHLVHVFATTNVGTGAWVEAVSAGNGDINSRAKFLSIHGDSASAYLIGFGTDISNVTTLATVPSGGILDKRVHIPDGTALSIFLKSLSGTINSGTDYIELSY